MMLIRIKRTLALLAALLCLSFALPAQAQPKKQPPAKEQQPGTLETLWRQAEEALSKQDFVAAVQALEKFLADRPDDPYAHFNLGFAYTGLGRRAEARKEYEKAAALEPKMTAAYVNLGLLLLEQDPAASAQHLQKAAELAPESSRLHFLLGEARERSGNGAAAIESYRAALALEEGPANPPAGEKETVRFDAHFALGRVLLASGRAAEAEQQFRAAVGLRKEHPPARVGLAESLVAQRKLEEAVKEYAAYLALRPQDNDTRFQLASAYADLGRNEDSLAELDRLEASAVRTPQVLNLRADLLLRARKFPEAVAALEQLLATQPNDAELHARLGRVRMELRDFPAAEKELVLALRAKPELTDALRDLGTVYYLAENYPQALAVLAEMEKREALGAGSWFIRAICYDKLQKKAEALAAYKQFVALDQGRSEKQDFQARQRIRILTRELEKKR